jgi:multisubunit Na+/H+ antiporter MnhG subunit
MAGMASDRSRETEVSRGTATESVAPASATEDDRPAERLDDVADRDELRRRYYGLLQELRVLLPGVQILVAFLLTAPFAARFEGLAAGERGLYGIALGSGVGAVVVFSAPIAMHRFGDRRSRSARLTWSIRMVRVGLVLLAVALLAASALIWAFVFDWVVSVVASAVLLVVVVAAWVSLPSGPGRDHHVFRG